jgi:hypothetical protein
MPVLAAFIVLLVFAPVADASCIKRHGVPIANGSSPSAETWTVEGTIGNNGSCREWLFGMEFNIPKAISWGWGTGIPAGGHLSSDFHIDASDDLLEDGSYRVLSGSVGGDVAKLVVTLSNGKHREIHPKSVPAPLRSRIVWLRNVRYFVDYYPPTGFVSSVSLLSASGQLLYRVSGSEGEFF